MAVGIVGSYPQAPVAPATWPSSGNATPMAPSPAYGADAYSGTVPAQPGYAPLATTAAAGSNIARYGAWGLGALGAARFILPHVATGWMKVALVLGGALAGNILWNKLEQDVPADKAGGVGHVGTMAAGAGGAFMVGRALLGTNPAGWLIGGIIAGGAYIGHKLYAGIAKP